MTEFTQPEPINHNELRRMLSELVTEIVDACYDDDSTFGQLNKDKLMRRLHRTIEGIRLDGDDS